MYEDPQDLFREMDEMFSRLFTRMDRGFAGGNPQVSGYHFVVSGGNDDPDMQEEPGLPDRAAAGPVAEVHRIGDEVDRKSVVLGKSVDNGGGRII